MKKITQIAILFSSLLLLLSVSNPEKKMQKIVEKVWKNRAIRMEQVQMEKKPENISQLNRVFDEKELIGYVCYTYSNGCKIGGCSAPTEKRDETYEVFEYIIVYDTNFVIQKIDIANYGGEYGYEICRPNWLKQFKGKKNGFKLNTNIDGIAGATISATYLIDDINTLYKTMRKLKEDGVL